MINTVEMLYDNVLVKMDERTEKTHNGFYIPVKSVSDHERGTVVAVGTGIINKKGVTIPLDVSVNETIALPTKCGQQITMNGEQYRLIKESDILFIIDAEV